MSRPSSVRSAPGTVIELRASRRHHLLLIVVYLVALAALPAIDLPVGWLIPVGLSLPVILLHELGTASAVAVSLSLGADGRLSLREAGDTTWTDRTIAAAFVSDWLIVLGLKGRRRRLVLFPDSMTADQFRRLRVFLDLHGASA